MTTEGDVREMTPEALNEWIGLQRGYRPDPISGHWLDKDNHQIDLPLWVYEAGAALALCLEIADKHGYTLTIISMMTHFGVGFMWRLADRRAVYSAEGDTPALALSRLAALALLERG